MQMAALIRSASMTIAENLLRDNDTTAFLRAQKFDLVLRDIVSWPTGLLAQMLDVPEVDVYPSGTFQPIFGQRYSVPNPVAYLPQMISSLVPALVRF